MRGIATLSEIEEKWSLLDVLKANEALVMDSIIESEVKRQIQERTRAEAASASKR